ncbi:hypothetical protein GW17_00032801, partial [Ensete ventricosum]
KKRKGRKKKSLAAVLACALPARPHCPRVYREPSPPSPLAGRLRALVALGSPACPCCPQVARETSLPSQLAGDYRPRAGRETEATTERRTQFRQRHLRVVPVPSTMASSAHSRGSLRTERQVPPARGNGPARPRSSSAKRSVRVFSDDDKAAHEKRGSEQDEREVGYSPRVEEAPSGVPTGKKSHKERLTMAKTRLDVLKRAWRNSTKANEGSLG